LPPREEFRERIKKRKREAKSLFMPSDKNEVRHESRYLRYDKR
jgi:hypothetical protein